MNGVEGALEIFKTFIWAIFEAIKTLFEIPIIKYAIIIAVIVIAIIFFAKILFNRIKKKQYNTRR